LIPIAFIQEWSEHAPWPELAQVEQDLIISRALCDLFNSPDLKGRIAFRGGTAIHKLLFSRPLRYSEDIDLVQTTAEPIGPTIDAIRKALSWLGRCTREQAAHSMHLTFKFSPESEATRKLKLKVELNTREHENLLGLANYPFNVASTWYFATADIVSFEPEELFGTKLRALLQRHKNRDLFDLHQALRQLTLAPDKVIACLEHYLALEGNPISRANAERRMLEKLNRNMIEDIAPLLPPGIAFTEPNALAAFDKVWGGFIRRIPGEPWKLTATTIEEIRSTKFPAFLIDSEK
jgi:predicted nucleotidyltransferase component of viral defense system